MKYLYSFIVFILLLVFVSCDKEAVDKKDDTLYTDSISAPILLNCSQGDYSDTIVLSWSKVDDAEKYFVYRNSSEFGLFILIDSVDASFNQYVNVSFLSNILSNDVHYFYKITAISKQRSESDFSNVLEGWSSQKEAKLNSFFLELKTGAFWDYKWTYSKSSWGGSPNTSTGKFRVQLGDSKIIEDLTAYEVEVYGDAGEYKPRWSYLVYDDEKQILYGSNGVSLTVIFDAFKGIWIGGGFFTELPSSIVFKANSANVSKGAAIGPGYTISRSSSSDDIVCVDGYGCINGGGAEENYNQTEYYLPKAGPVGYHQTYSYSDYNSQATYVENVELLACSALDQEGVFITEIEPNQFPGSLQTITADKVVIGDIGPADETTFVSGTTLVLGSEVSYSITMHDFYKFVTRSASNTITINWDKVKYPNARFDACVYLIEKSLNGWVAKKMKYDESGTDGITYCFMFSTNTIVGASYVISVKSVNNTERIPYSISIQEGAIN